MNIIRLLVAEDHNVVRQGLVGILEKYEDICIVGEAEDGKSLVGKYFEHNPDIVLSDISMPRVGGLAAARMILNRKKDAKIIFLSMFDSDEYVYRALDAGASGLISKGVVKNELIFVIRSVMNGETYFLGKSKEEITEIKERYEHGSEAFNKSKTYSLTEREREILSLIAEGLSSEEIAQRLYLGKRTVDACRAAIMGKLNIKSLPQLIKYAVETAYDKKRMQNGENQLL
jgi:DNA-binding NarL/FixJ family response regulator